MKRPMIVMLSFPFAVSLMIAQRAIQALADIHVGCVLDW
jgi:hypothetical protein